MSNYTKISFNASKGAALLLQAFKHGVTSNMQNESFLSNIYFTTFQKATLLWDSLYRDMPTQFHINLILKESKICIFSK